LLRKLRFTPPSRQVYAEDYEAFRAHGLSFSCYTDPVERERATFYRHHFTFGGKVRSGGFSVSTGNRYGIKEARAYSNALRRLAEFGKFFRETIIECLDYQELIAKYGHRRNCVLYCDPPYVDTERLYAHQFTRGDHVFLANALFHSPAHVVCTYYDHPLIRELYPPQFWLWESVQATKNSQFVKGNKASTTEWIISRRSA